MLSVPIGTNVSYRLKHLSLIAYEEIRSGHMVSHEK